MFPLDAMRTYQPMLPTQPSALGTRGNSHPDIPPVEPTPVSEREYDASDLYGSGGPKATDINQDNLGDCYYVATMAALADKTPQRITDAIKYNEDTGNFTVHIYNGDEWVDVEVSQAEIQDNIDRHGGSTVDNGNTKGAIWPSVMEVAYAKVLGGDLEKGYQELDGGYSADAFEALTGDSGQEMSRALIAMLGPEWAAQTIQQALDAGRPVTLSTNPENTANWFERNILGEHDAPQDGLVDNHVYTVEGVKVVDGEVVLELRNPWGHNGVEGFKDTGATMEVKLSDITKNGGLECINLGPAG